jgi:outer membrane immunogenic protein
MPAGPYIGMTAGVGSSNFIDPIYDWYGGTAGGLVVGGLAGYNFHWGPAILGLEADANWNSARSPSQWDSTYFLDWDASLRARVGFDTGGITPFVTGGVAIGAPRNVDSSSTWAQTPLGWTAGIGAELGLGERVTARVEYRHIDFGTKNYGYDIKPTKDSLQFGLVYRLGN